jgi:hypothetical protein
VRRRFVAQIAGLRLNSGPHLLAQGSQFLLDLVDLLLLAVNGLVQRFQQFFGKAQLGFNFREAGFHIGSWCWRYSARTTISTPRHATICPGANLGDLAALRLAVHGRLACGDRLLAASTAVGNARQFQQIAQQGIRDLQ